MRRTFRSLENPNYRIWIAGVRIPMIARMYSDLMPRSVPI